MAGISKINGILTASIAKLNNMTLGGAGSGSGGTETTVGSYSVHTFLTGANFVWTAGAGDKVVSFYPGESTTRRPNRQARTPSATPAERPPMVWAEAVHPNTCIGEMIRAPIRVPRLLATSFAPRS